MKTYEIDDLRPPPSSGPATSVAAAQSVASAAATLRAQVYAAIRAAGERGMTDEELQDALGVAGDTERPRRWELARTASIRRAGTTRSTRSGRQADVWVATGRPLHATDRTWWQEEEKNEQVTDSEA